MKHIILHLDKKMFYKMSQDKVEKEINMEQSLTWEEYVTLLFNIQ